jgi:PAS domain S-box-containing protein
MKSNNQLKTQKLRLMLYTLMAISMFTSALIFLQFTLVPHIFCAILFIGLMWVQVHLSSRNKSLSFQFSALSELAAEREISEHLNHIELRDREARSFVEALRNGTEPNTFQFLNAKKGLGENLFSLKTKLDHYRIEEQKISWLQGGLAKFSDLLKTGNSLEEFTSIILSQLVTYVSANQGGLYVESEEDNATRYMELKSCYAYDRKKFVSRRIYPGEGLLGECMLGQSLIYMTDVPNDYVTITSGLGEATPRNIIIVPLIFNEKFYGAIELASFVILDQYKTDFLTKISEGIAAEIATRKTVEHTEKLLQQSQNLTHELQAQDEELKQNMEELTATQEQMGRKQAELDSVFSAINNTVASVEFDMNRKISTANSIFLSLTGYSLADLQLNNFKSLLPDAEKNKPQHDLMWHNLEDSKFFSGEFKFISKTGEELWLSGTFNPICDGKGRPTKVIMIAQFTTQEKAKQLELTGTVSALKNSLPYVELDKNFICKSANERFLNMFSLRKIELKNKPFCGFLAGNSDNKFKMNLTGESVQTYFEEILQFNNNGITYHYRTTFTVVRNLQHEVTRILVLLADQSSAIKMSAVA